MVLSRGVAWRGKRVRGETPWSTSSAVKVGLAKEIVPLLIIIVAPVDEHAAVVVRVFFEFSVYVYPFIVEFDAVSSAQLVDWFDGVQGCF